MLHFVCWQLSSSYTQRNTYVHTYVHTRIPNSKAPPLCKRPRYLRRPRQTLAASWWLLAALKCLAVGKNAISITKFHFNWFCICRPNSVQKSTQSGVILRAPSLLSADLFYTLLQPQKSNDPSAQGLSENVEIFVILRFRLVSTPLCAA